MKEAFWGVLIVILGLFGIVIINIFQNITVGNDRTYYLLKETTEAAAIDAIDLTYYRLNGEIRIVTDKFVENFTRRFAENLGDYGNYYIIVEDINETPPKVSVKVKTSITSLEGDTFGISNRIDGIIETKYTIDKITEFLGITYEEWINRDNVNISEEEDACSITTYGSEELECITGDLEFVAWGETGIVKTACDDEIYGEESREVTYKICECGKWTEKTEEVESTPVKRSNQYVYNWLFEKEGEIRDIYETDITRVYLEDCTTGIEIYVPKDLTKKEPSNDNSEYEICPSGGITINQGSTIILHANYIPEDSSNRTVYWTNSNKDVLTIQSSNPLTDSGYSKAGITGEKIGTTIITATTTNGKKATCKVEVVDGEVDSVDCEDKTITVGSSSTMTSTYEPYTANNTEFTWSSSNTSVGTINSDTGVVTGKSAGTSTITVTAENGETGTCTLKVNESKVCYLASEVGSYWQHRVVTFPDGAEFFLVCTEYEENPKDEELQENEEITIGYETGNFTNVTKEMIIYYEDCTKNYSLVPGDTQTVKYYEWECLPKKPDKCYKVLAGTYTYTPLVKEYTGTYTCKTHIITTVLVEEVDKKCAHWEIVGLNPADLVGDINVNYVDGYVCPDGMYSSEGGKYCCYN
ncbi:MAG TPA: DUF5411 family protein [Bacilli bacterium]|nr:DUF5411 family protein [Bacilli bacterium]